MDVKVYKKEEVLQPSGTSEYVYVPDVIDLYTHFKRESIDTDIVEGVWNINVYASQHDVEIKGTTLIIQDETSFISGTTLNINYELSVDVLSCVDLLEEGTKDLLIQQCTLATIKQRGLDPVELDDGIEWSEALLGEVNVVQLMNEISEAVAKTTTSVTVMFDTITDSEGNSYLSYKLQGVA